MSSDGSSIDLSVHNPLIGLDLPRLEKEMDEYQKWLDERTDEAYRIAQEVFDNPEFTQVGYDPTRRGFFYDRETGEAIVEADTVVQVGHLVLARNAKKIDAEVKKIVDKGYERAKKILTEKIDDLHKIAKALLIYETLSGVWVLEKRLSLLIHTQTILYII